MNPYTTQTRARIQPHDLTNAVFTGAFIAAPALPMLERHRGWQAEAEMDRLLKQHGAKSHTVQSRFAMLRQMLGAALVRAGARLAGTSPSAVEPETALAARMLETAS
jgi:hypothetical protein